MGEVPGSVLASRKIETSDLVLSFGEEIAVGNGTNEIASDAHET